MIDRTMAQGMKRTLRTFIAFLLFSGNVIAASLKPTVSIQKSSGDTLMVESSSTASPNCGGSYWVGTTAGVLSIPRAVNNTPIFCQWLLKAKDKHNTIALSATETSLDFAAPKFNSRLEARDGWSSDSPLIGALETSPEREITRADFKLYNPMKASSGFMLIRFWNEGYDPVLINFTYYSCGGEVESSGRISSPIFKELSLLPSIVSCDWRLKKPSTSLYAYLKPIFLNITGCCSLQLRSNSSMRVLENVARQINNSSNILHDNFTKRQNLIAPSANEDVLCSSDPLESNVVPICGDSIRLVAFESDFATLSYLLLKPEKAVGFSTMYDSFKVPNQLGSRSKTIVWYLDYCALTIFTPIGIVIGLLIMFYQGGKKRQKKCSKFDATGEVSHDSTERCCEKPSASVRSSGEQHDEFQVSAVKCTESSTNEPRVLTKFQRTHSGSFDNDVAGRKAQYSEVENLDCNTTELPPVINQDPTVPMAPDIGEDESSNCLLHNVLVDSEKRYANGVKMHKVRFDPEM